MKPNYREISPEEEIGQGWDDYQQGKEGTDLFKKSKNFCARSASQRTEYPSPANSNFPLTNSNRGYRFAA